MMNYSKIDFSKYTLKNLVRLIGSSRYWDLPPMLEEVFNKIDAKDENKQFKDKIVTVLPTTGELSTRYIIGVNEWYWNGSVFIKLAGSSSGEGVINLSYIPSETNGIIVSDSGTDAIVPLSGINAGLLSPIDKVKLDNTTGINSGNQTSIVGILGTKADFNTALTDGDFLFAGDASTYTDENAQDAVGTILVDSSEIDFTYNNATPSITATIKVGSIDETKLNTSVNTALNLANTAVQPIGLTNIFNKIVDDTDDIIEGIVNKFSTVAEKDKLAQITVTQPVNLDTLESDTTINNTKVTNATHTGDATGATALTLATVNANVGSFGTASSVPQYTVNAKGLVTTSANIPIQISQSQVTNLETELENKEDLSNKATTLTPSVTLYPNNNAVIAQLNLKQNSLNFKSPQDYGAIGDGIADDTNAIQNCINANSTILFFGTYRTSATINLKSNILIKSDRAKIENKLDNVPIIKGNNINNFKLLGNLTLLGNGNYNNVNNTNVQLSKSGLILINCYEYTIDDLDATNIQGFGVYIDGTIYDVPNQRKQKIIRNFYAKNCFYGLQIGNVGNQSEYVELVTPTIISCKYGITITSGNITITGGNINNNEIGLYIEATIGSNGAHGIINGININHNLINLYLLNIDLGQTISNCHLYGDATNSVILNNCIGVNFSNCIIDGKIEAITGSLVGKNIFSNCQLEPDVVINATSLNRVKFINCYNRNTTGFIHNSTF